MLDKETRAEYASSALNAYLEHKGEPDEAQEIGEQVIDLMTDLLHLCRSNGMKRRDILRIPSIVEMHLRSEK